MDSPSQTHWVFAGALATYVAVVACILLTTFSASAPKSVGAVKVDITRFQPPEVRELTAEAREELAETEAEAEEFAREAVRVDPQAEGDAARRDAERFDVASEPVADGGPITVNDGAAEAEGLALLASLEGIGDAGLSGKGGTGSRGRPGPPGMERGKTNSLTN